MSYKIVLTDDFKNFLDTAKSDKAIEIAQNLKKNKVDVEIICQSTGLSREQVEKL